MTVTHLGKSCGCSFTLEQGKPSGVSVYALTGLGTRAERLTLSPAQLAAVCAEITRELEWRNDPPQTVTKEEHKL